MSEQQWMKIKAKHTAMINQMVEDSGLEGKEREAYILGICNGILAASRIMNTQVLSK
jgi:phosphoribosylformylglycinamidine (FGAM) synthase-like amidotransferase family enzyme